MKLLEVHLMSQGRAQVRIKGFRLPTMALCRQSTGKIGWCILNIRRTGVERKKILDRGLGLLLVCSHVTPGPAPPQIGVS